MVSTRWPIWHCFDKDDCRFHPQRADAAIAYRHRAAAFVASHSHTLGVALKPRHNWCTRHPPLASQISNIRVLQQTSNDALGLGWAATPWLLPPPICRRHHALPTIAAAFAAAFANGIPDALPSLLAFSADSPAHLAHSRPVVFAFILAYAHSPLVAWMLQTFA